MSPSSSLTTIPDDQTLAPIATWILEHCAARVSSATTFKPSATTALYSRLHRKLAPYSPAFSAEFSTNLAACIAEIRYCLTLSPKCKQVRQDFVHLLQTMQDMEGMRRTTVNRALEPHSTEKRDWSKKRRKVTVVRENQTETLRERSGAAEKLFVSAFLGLKRQLIVQSIYETPYSLSKCLAFLNTLLPNPVSEQTLQSRWTLPDSHGPAHQLRIELYDLLDKVDVYLEKRTVISNRKRKSHEPENGKAFEDSGPGGENGSMIPEEERSSIESFAVLREYDAALSWERACEQVMEYLQAAEQLLLDVLRTEQCPTCGEDSCVGITEGKTILQKIQTHRCASP
ncbi:uncharacterized protein SPPG_05797 [Spizellomyces punctatus DAOM BR117]|uniref:Uncharacterized protein n=1 Tax=Spizellomyces punctatus (strain DAOM BR117) TaxID=645134 RepID=A0A0L0HB61_SPIPD|nr:uncharacterized protein SPPG_05797 [Spizellomyces punctatus DAOM BR117]KNC98820.1 hypothetical protein SPPG_05797 [Spizellomyces punctatus DAOM BR117]|eukprot:XP_016606860.1 hypothetical protein SPPG_05797 [Spizellomyces punctatus DAOM BR117]